MRAPVDPAPPAAPCQLQRRQRAELRALAARIGHPATIHPLGQRNAARATPLVDGVARATSPGQPTLDEMAATATTCLPGAGF